MPNSARVDDIVPMEALRCLANVLLQNRSLQMYFDSMNGLEAALLQHEVIAVVTQFCGSEPHQRKSTSPQKSENLSMEAEFLICRLIFLSTADRKNWNMSTPIVPRIAAVLSKFVVQVCETLPRLTNAKDAMWAGLIDSPVLTQEIVLGELWKAAFGVTALTSSNSTIDDRYNNPLWLDGEALECFADFPADKCFTDCWFPDGDYNILDFLINTLDRALSIEPEAVQASADGSFFANSSDNVAPLMLILGNLARSSPKAKQIIETAILPPQIDRSLPIERSPTLTGRVVRLLSAVTPENVRHCTGDLLFVLCDLDPKTLVDRIGYGSAAGFLFQRGLLQESMGGIGGSKTPMSISAENDVELPYSLNPITGQVENGKSKENDDMTEEEKEEEAEKLFVLFDRLRKTGVVTVGLPAFST
ncbi:hypothetical protein M427DRAFT_141717 [Gonapodya prolifera JEL478]|uniref:Uncharacterized protein n=1 Tax=Gonapodya prolifera (strain JEL478) TaxID=1344416 RepID=A0A139AZC2_GONPJ|nr:hypothetical protein M427DRAFT_141717 [Gonapodya prolifera JEL478]|eukprot:KXS22102.1 hypothetical protein M427DRAFT_141717 [Gonapodya prolifera JEL478]